MTNSIVVLNGAGGKYNQTTNTPDCCENLGSSVVHYERKDHKYSYVSIIPLNLLDDFFKEERNLILYIEILGDIFKFDCKLINSPTEVFHKNVTDLNPPDKNYYVEIIMNAKLSNKTIVAFHTCLRYLWYLHYSHIAITCVNLYRLGLNVSSLDILAIASSFQERTGRALVAANLTDIDAFVYFPNRDNIFAELARNQNFNTAFMRCPIYYQPLISVKGNFFDEDAVPYKLSAKNLLAALGSVENIDEIPPVIITSCIKAIEAYVSAKQCVDDIYRSLGRSFSGVDRIILNDEIIEQGFIDIKSMDLSGRKINTRVVFTKALAKELITETTKTND